MRVSQIQNLTWAGNVLVLGGLVWVGLQFWSINKQNKQKAAEPVWLKAKTADDVGKSRWPGDLAAFKHIWETEVGGKVKPPPPPPNTVVVKVDKVAEFKAKLKYVGGWEFTKEPERSTARVTFDSKDMTISPGYSVGGYQLTQFTFKNDDADPKKRTARLVFRNPEGADIVIEQSPSTGQPLLDAAGGPIQKAFTDPFKEGRITEKSIEQQAFQNADGEWVIPDQEQLWIEKFGEADIWSKLATKADVDKDGVPRGLRIMSFPETGTALAPSHGIGQGDIIRSINGVAVTSKEEILNYLRGDGRGLEKYDVVVETDGAKRTVVYRVRRLHRPDHPARD